MIVWPTERVADLVRVGGGVINSPFVHPDVPRETPTLMVEQRTSQSDGTDSNGRQVNSYEHIGALRVCRPVVIAVAIVQDRSNVGRRIGTVPEAHLVSPP